MSGSRTVIIGAGIAGVSAAGAMRQAGYEGEIVLIGDEAELPYRRPPVSKEIVRGDKTADDIRIKKAEWYADQCIELRTGTTVEALDVDQRMVRLGDGTDITYDQVLLATGGRARLLGEGHRGITLRSVADAPAVLEHLSAKQPLVVVGAGLIGSEIAASARMAGCTVTLLETAATPLPRLLPPDLAGLYADLHRAEGTQLETGVDVASMADADGETVVTAADGRSWSAPMVVVAVGMEPNTELAEKAGLDVANGIVVDALGRTSAPGVFAAGDVANTPHPLTGARQRIEHWQHAQNHGTAVGKVMAGGDTPFAEVPWCWSDQYGHTLQVTGWPDVGHDVVVRGSLVDRDFTAFHLEAGTVRGAISIGRPREIRTARAWIGDEARPDVAILADDGAELATAVA